MITTRTNIPDDVKPIIVERVSNRRDGQRLASKYEEYMTRGKLVQAMRTKSQIEAMYDEEYHKYCKENESVYLSVKEVEKGFTQEQGIKFRTNMDTICMVIDIIDTCCNNINEVLQESINKSTTITQFGSLSDIAAEVKRLMKGFKPESEKHEELWADTLDSIESYLFMRAKAYHKKVEALSKKQIKEAV